MFRNDLPGEIKNVTKLFADDLKSIVNASNRVQVNQDITKLENWESLWLLNFNPKKCKFMHLIYNNNLLNQYFLNGVLLEEVKTEKYLGLFVSENLGWISRNLINRDYKILSRVYTTIIRPRL